MRKASALLLVSALAAGCTGGGGGSSPNYPDAPLGITASKGTSPDSVTVGWSAAAGAETYRVFRDGELIAEVPGLAYTDTGASPGGVPAAPTTLSASDGDSTASVAITWAVSEVPVGTSHEYVVQGVNGDGPGESSSADTGFRAGYPADEYEIVRDGVLLSTVPGLTNFDDATATGGPVPSTPSALLASDGAHANRVALTWNPASVQPGPAHAYAVRGSNAVGPGGLSSTDSGSRGANPVEGYEIVRDGLVVGSAATLSFDDLTADAAGTPAAPGNFAASNGQFTDKVVLSWTAPGAPVGTSHVYAVRAINAAGAGALSSEDMGFRSGNAVTGYEVRRGGSLLTSVGSATLSVDDTTADAGGVPATPAGFAASNGGFTDKVVLTWTASVVPPGDTHDYTVRALNVDGGGADATDSGFRAGLPILNYEILRDSAALTTINDTTFDDTTATPAGVPAGVANFAATDGAFPEKVVLSWDNANVPDGASHTYAIRAVNSAGPSVLSGGDAGFRGAFPVQSYSILRDGLPLAIVTDIDHEDTGAVPGDLPTAPVDLVASDGTFADRIRLTWLASTSSQGATHTYSVAAVNAAGTGPSATNDGHRSGESILRYEVSTDGVNWSDLGQILTTDDFGAPQGTLRNGIAAASEGVSGLNVTAEATGLGANPANNSNYQIRAVSLQGEGPAAADTGYRGVGTLSFQWERSSGDADANYSAVPGATAVTFVDDTVPPTGEGRFYRMVTSATAAAAVTSTSDRGYRDFRPLPTENIRQDVWTTAGGAVTALVESNGVLYIGGNFAQVGPMTGTFVAIDEATATRLPVGPIVDGGIYKSVADGTGGWFISGDFSAINGVPREELAHVLADGSLDLQFAPTILGGVVQAMDVSGDVLYVGGGFSTVNGQTRNKLAAFSISSGSLTNWNPNAGSSTTSISSVLVDGSQVLVGGSFMTIGGQPRNRLASVSAATGTPSAWNPNVNGTVRTLRKMGSTVFAGGDFTNVGVYLRNRLVAFDEFGDVSPWNPSADGEVVDLETDGTLVYAAGDFSSIGVATRNRIAAIDPTSGLPTVWNPGASSTVRAVAVSNGVVYAGGSFETIGGMNQQHFAALDASTGAVLPWPNASHTVTDIAVQDGRVYAAGSFATVGAIDRGRLAAIDLSTGLVTAWNPNMGPNSAVEALAIQDGVVYVGGFFTTIGGQTRNSLAAIDASTGDLTSWNPNPNAFVRDIEIDGGVVYVGGDFTTIGGASRSGVAALNVSNGLATGWAASPSTSTVNDLELGPDGTIYALGNFSFQSGGSTQIAALNPVTGVASTGFRVSAVSTMAVAGDKMYVGGGFGTITVNNGGTLVRNRLAAIQLTGPSAPFVTTWDPNVGTGAENVQGIGVSDGAVYAGGSFSTVSGQQRLRLAAIDEATGQPFSWNPLMGGTVHTVYATSDSVIVGGSIQSMNNYPHWTLGVFEPY